LLDPSTSTPSGFGNALSSLAGSIAGDASLDGTAVEIYVSGVSHLLSRADGFITILTGVWAPAAQEWDEVDPQTGPVTLDPAGAPHVEVARAFQDLAQSVAPAPLAVAEVRAANTTGQSEPPSQTVDVWVGLVAPDGAPRAARRLAIEREAPSRLSGLS